MLTFLPNLLKIPPKPRLATVQQNIFMCVKAPQKTSKWFVTGAPPHAFLSK